MTIADAYPAELQGLITVYFSRAELADLCLRLDVNFDSLPDTGLAAQARELVLLLARQNRLPELLEALRAERPRVAWPPVPPGYRPPAAAAPPAPSGGGGFSIGSVTAGNLIIGNDANMTVNQGSRHDPSGDARGALLAIEATLRDTLQTIEGLSVPDDARAGLIRIVVRLDRALRATPPDRVAQATEVADVAKELVEAAGAARPRPAVVRGLGDTLREAANALAGPVPAAPDLAAQFAAAVIDLAR